MTSCPLSCIIIHVVFHRGPAVRQEAGSPAKRGFRKRREHTLFHYTINLMPGRRLLPEGSGCLLLLPLGGICHEKESSIAAAGWRAAFGRLHRLWESGGGRLLRQRGGHSRPGGHFLGGRRHGPHLRAGGRLRPRLWLGRRGARPRAADSVHPHRHQHGFDHRLRLGHGRRRQRGRPHLDCDHPGRRVLYRRGAPHRRGRGLHLQHREGLQLGQRLHHAGLRRGHRRHHSGVPHDPGLFHLALHHGGGGHCAGARLRQRHLRL